MAAAVAVSPAVAHSGLVGHSASLSHRGASGCGFAQGAGFVPGLSLRGKLGSPVELGGRSVRPRAVVGLTKLCAQSATEKRPGLAGGEERETMKATDYYKPLVEGDILESTPEQVTIVAGAFALLAALCLKGVYMLGVTDGSVLGAVVAALVGYEFADFGSGVYHWSMDNYGSSKTPVFGTQIEAFQGHHELPWTITYRQVCNNIYKICQATTPFCVGALALVDNPYILIWMSTALAFINMSQELHKWSHSSPTQCHPVINQLQDLGLIVTRKEHLLHHRPPFEGNYCIVSGHCNPFLDKVGFFRWMEDRVYDINGAQARCWTNERLLGDTVESLGLKKGTDTIKRGTKTVSRGG
uniref:Lipid desaturase domain-containing protein n=2 Tax=Hemiselmis andersenii TaxID=464988 RepID=A0A7S1MU61_HEMAN